MSKGKLKLFNDNVETILSKEDNEVFEYCDEVKFFIVTKKEI